MLFRRARVERDHEHRRSASLKELKTVFKAEEQGLWERSDAAPLGAPQRGIRCEGWRSDPRGSEVNIETEVDVETIHGMRIQTSDDVHRTVGATGKASGMDTMLDALGRPSAVVMISPGADINDASNPSAARRGRPTDRCPSRRAHGHGGRRLRRNHLLSSGRGHATAASRLHVRCVWGTA